jgi:hypothetical protein
MLFGQLPHQFQQVHVTSRDGSAICALLRGSWRPNRSSVAVDFDQLSSLEHLIVSTGAGPLVWRGIRDRPDLVDYEAGESLKQSYRTSQIFTEIQSLAIERVVRILEPAGIVPLSFKGWAVARYYADPGTRPSGDIDLCAPPGRYQDAAGLLARQSDLPADFAIGETSTGLSLDWELPGQVTRVDLQRDLDRFRLSPLDEVFARAERVPVGSAHVLVPCAEDHLRLICLHFLEHGGWRPTWLCDVGAVLEAVGSGFDWERCLGTDRLVRQQVLTVVRLAHELLDARIDALPADCRLEALPRWLVPAIMKQWSRPFSAYFPRPLFSYVLTRWPDKIASEIAARWPDPVRATFELGRAFDDRPRWPLQATFFARSMMSFLARSARN